MASGALLLGRVTYEVFAAAWPSRTGVIAGDLAQAVAQLKREVAGDILVNGSIRLVQALAAHDLVDEYRLMVFPAVLGAGKRLFGETSAPAAFRLTEAAPSASGDSLARTVGPAGR